MFQALQTITIDNVRENIDTIPTFVEVANSQRGSECVGND